ncbi:TetR/AcrR family transcriptional regulator [Lysinibacillus sp. KU-BSD001]|uniref:TetR/AcrR family transcriptional regulator n=1 Tax=Lysinibacillus sp. KU-BSD001 TaxID=3141328 RepID=UPI0036EDF522
MGKYFTEDDIQLLKEKLREACATGWKTKGYKLTNIAFLTKEVGISTGSFYRLYETKEELFLEVLLMIQHQLKEQWHSIMETTPGIEGFKKAMQWLFEEYIKHPKLYNFNSPDYVLFLNKLPQEEIESFRENDEHFLHNVLEHSGLQLKISKEQAYGIFSTLLFTATMEKDFGYNKQEIFSFLLDSSIHQIFETDKEDNN